VGDKDRILFVYKAVSVRENVNIVDKHIGQAIPLKEKVSLMEVHRKKQKE